MNPVLALLFLAALPPALMASAHFYAIASQDRKSRFVVVLDPRIRNVRRVVDDHVAKYRVAIDQIWDSSVKGYSAVIPVKQVDALRRDVRVQSVQPRDIEEF